MTAKNFSRREFIGKTTAGIAGATISAGFSPVIKGNVKEGSLNDFGNYHYDAAFREAVEQLPVEELYDYHEHLSTAPVHVPRRNPGAKPAPEEIVIPGKGWRLVWNSGSSIVTRTAVDDFRDYLEKSQGVIVEIDEKSSLEDWQSMSRAIIVGTRDQLPGCGLTLEGPKGYEITASPSRVIVCGYDDRGAMFGLYNLEARMNLREAPFLPGDLKTVRHSLFDSRMVLSWMGWKEWPDRLLSHLVHDGIDAIFASVYANPNGDRTAAETALDPRGRLMERIRHQDPAWVRDLINRAARFGIKVYTPIVWQFEDTPENQMGLRELVRDILDKFPDIQGYVLLCTEGFWYKGSKSIKRGDKEYFPDYARNFGKAVGIVAEECHRVNPSIEILPWDYNIPNRPENIEMKKYFIQQLPTSVIPLPTWENGKSFEMDGMRGHLGDYSLSQVGPAEVTEAQIEETRKRGMKVYCKADTFASWQFGTSPYIPAPGQWYKRYMALEKHGVNGTLETWSYGYKPNFVSELRAWTCWSDAPSKEDLFNMMASRIFGEEVKDKVVKAWEYFSEAIQLVPDTGASMGTNHALGNPLFFQQPPARTLTRYYSWSDFDLWKRCCHGSSINPYWPYTNTRMVFYPDFTNRANRAETYARGRSGVQVTRDTKVLPVFIKYLRQASDQMEKGLKLYREAALTGPRSKLQQAVREVVIAEQIQRMIQSNCALLEFEDLRLQLVNEQGSQKSAAILDRMESIIRDEIVRTELSLLAATRDSRLGFQFEQDYVYTPFSLKEKLEVLKKTLNEQLPDTRSRI